MKDSLKEFYKLLIENKIDFLDLAIIYVKYLKEREQDYREQLVEMILIASMYRDQKLNSSSKKSLEDRYKKAVIKSGVFAGTKFEEELKKWEKIMATGKHLQNALAKMYLHLKEQGLLNN